jgi:hypothetical protein
LFQAPLATIILMVLKLLMIESHRTNLVQLAEAIVNSWDKPKEEIIAVILEYDFNKKEAIEVFNEFSDGYRSGRNGLTKDPNDNRVIFNIARKKGDYCKKYITQDKVFIKLFAVTILVILGISFVSFIAYLMLSLYRG